MPDLPPSAQAIDMAGNGLDEVIGRPVDELKISARSGNSVFLLLGVPERVVGELPKARVRLDPAAGVENPPVLKAHGRKLTPTATTRVQRVDTSGSGLLDV